MSGKWAVYSSNLKYLTNGEKEAYVFRVSLPKFRHRLTLSSKTIFEIATGSILLRYVEIREAIYN